MDTSGWGVGFQSRRAGREQSGVVPRWSMSSGLFRCSQNKALVSYVPLAGQGVCGWGGGSV